jgi:hypothetical protein
MPYEMEFIMVRKNLALLLVLFGLAAFGLAAFGLAACGGDDSEPNNPPGDQVDAQADQGRTSDAGADGRQEADAVQREADARQGDADAGPRVDGDATPRSDADAGVPGDAALESEVAVGPATGLCDKAHWPYWITSNFMAPGSPPYFAVDGIPTTQFQTGGPQAGDEFIQIDFHGPITFSGMTLDYSMSAGDYPRGYKVYVSNNPTPVEADVVAAAGGLDAGLAAPGAALDISFAAPATGRYVRLMQTGSVAVPWWSIPELSLKNCVSGAGVTGGGSDAGIGGRGTWSAKAYNSGLVIRESFGAFTTNAANMIDDMPAPVPEAGGGGDGGDGASGDDAGDGASSDDAGDGASAADAGDGASAADGSSVADAGDGADGAGGGLVPNLGTQWQSGNPPLNGSWFIVDLGAVGSLHGVHLTHGGTGGGDSPASLTVSLSTNDIDYTDVVVLAPGAAVLDLPFGGSARFVRVVNVGTRAGGAWWSVQDFSLRP